MINIKKILVNILAFLILFFGVVLILIGMKDIKERKDFIEQKNIHKNIDTTLSLEEQLSQTYNPIFSKWKLINDDFIGYLEWENDLLYDYNFESEDKHPHLVVHPENEEMYKRMDIEQQYKTFGQEFMDPSNVINNNNSSDDQNLILYGHYVYRDKKLKFSPLHQLKNDKVLEEFNEFSFTFEHEQRKYEVVKVFEYDQRSFNGDIGITPFSTNYTKEDFDKYMSRINDEFKTYINKELNYNDNFLTLQTCIEMDKNNVLIVIGKEIDRIYF